MEKRPIITKQTGVSIGLMGVICGLFFQAGNLWNSHDLLVKRVHAIEEDRVESRKDWLEWRETVTADMATLKAKITFQVPDSLVPPVPPKKAVGP